LECGGSTPLSFFSSHRDGQAFDGACSEEKKKAVSSHRTPK
jgi:hypothetical protein